MLKYVKVCQEEILLEEIKRADNCFPRSLSSRGIDLQKYAQKIGSYAENYQVYEGAKKVGFFSFYANNADKSQRVYLTLIVVKNDYHGRGIGKDILAFICKYAKGQGLSAVKLEVDRENFGAIEFYKKSGFKILEENQEAYFMEKEV